MTADTLKKYLSAFGSLHRNKNSRLGDAPHTPVLLLAVLDEVTAGRITENLVPLSSDLIVAFHQNWLAWLPGTRDERITLPFRHLVHDGFWELVQDGQRVEERQFSSPSIRQLQSLDGARLAPDLWDLLQTPMAVQALRVHLLQTYFPPDPHLWQPPAPRQALDYEAERLAAQAQSRFQTRRVQEPKDDVGYYVRHTLFPRVVKSFYDDTCAVCRLKAGALNRTLVEAAHIMPFAALKLSPHPFREGQRLVAGWVPFMPPRRPNDPQTPRTEPPKYPTPARINPAHQFARSPHTTSETTQRRLKKNSDAREAPSAFGSCGAAPDMGQEGQARGPASTPLGIGRGNPPWLPFFSLLLPPPLCPPQN